MEDYGIRLQRAFFRNRSPLSLWESCPNVMLWETIGAEECAVMSNEEIISLLGCVSTVLLFPEPLPAIYLGVEPEFERLSSDTVIRAMTTDSDVTVRKENNILGEEPLYLVDCNFTWMLIFTTETTSNGERLCVLLHASSM